jgi:hypothetical protein
MPVTSFHPVQPINQFGRYMCIIPMRNTGIANVSEDKNVRLQVAVSLYFFKDANCESFCEDVGRMDSCGKAAARASTRVRRDMRAGEWTRMRWVCGNGRMAESTPAREVVVVIIGSTSASFSSLGLAQLLRLIKLQPAKEQAHPYIRNSTSLVSDTSTISASKPISSISSATLASVHISPSGPTYSSSYSTTPLSAKSEICTE